MTRFIRRVLGALSLDAATYEDVEADSAALPQAVLVVLLAGIGAGIGNAGIGDDDVRERQRPRCGAWSRRARILGVDAVVERIELQRGVAPEQHRVDPCRLDARNGFGWRRCRRARNSDALALRQQR